MLKNPHELQYIQSRAEMNFAVVDEYTDDMTHGLTFDPVKGIEGPDGSIWIWDGAHRIEAAKKAGVVLDVELKPGGKEDAEWAAFSANTKHGLRRSAADIERVVKHALKHPHAAHKSDREIARHCGVSPTTVGKYRKDSSVARSVHAGQMARTVSRGESTYQMTLPERKPPQQETPKESVWGRKCREAVGKCYRTISGDIVKIESADETAGTMIGVSYTAHERRQDMYPYAELSYELPERNWLSRKRDYERTQEEQKHTQKPEDTQEPIQDPEEAPEETKRVIYTCHFCQQTFREHEIGGGESVFVHCHKSRLSGVICTDCAEKAYRELSSYLSLHTDEETMKFYSEDRKKVHQAGFQIYRPNWEQKRLNRHTDRGTWVKVEDFPTKKALKERIAHLEKDPKVVFDSH